MEQQQDSTVAFDVEDGIAWVRFNRPEKRNCMSPALNRRMMEVLDELEFRDDVGVLVLTGEGTAWSAGMDLKEYFRETEAQGLGAVRRSQRESYGWWRRLRWYQKPTIAMVNGWCFGGGYGPLFACDLAFAADEAGDAAGENDRRRHASRGDGCRTARGLVGTMVPGHRRFLRRIAAPRGGVLPHSAAQALIRVRPSSARRSATSARSCSTIPFRSAAEVRTDGSRPRSWANPSRINVRWTYRT